MTGLALGKAGGQGKPPGKHLKLGWKTRTRPEPMAWAGWEDHGAGTWSLAREGQGDCGARRTLPAHLATSPSRAAPSGSCQGHLCAQRRGPAPPDTFASRHTLTAPEQPNNQGTEMGGILLSPLRQPSCRWLSLDAPHCARGHLL